ncbi:MAG: glycosyltransferase [Candidatus Saccharibacteria bacterium]
MKTKLKLYIKKHPRLLAVARRVKRSLMSKDIQVFKSDYHKWIATKEAELWDVLNIDDKEPLISVVVPVYNTPDKYLKPLIQSLFDQTYSNWQLCISDASTDAKRSRAIRATSKLDGRIKYHFKKGLHISDNTNEGFKLADGEFIGLLDHDDVLSPHALKEVVFAINRHADVDVLYSDEDKLSDDGTQRSLPFFKPDWSPDLLLGVNYITHFLVVRRSLIDKLGGLRSKYDGAQDYDLLLRLTEITDRIIHIPKILYHWRLADGSTAKSVGEKSYADNAGQEALRDAVKRRKIRAEVVEIPERPTNYRLKYVLPKKQPKVSIIIPFKDRPILLERCVSSIIDKTTYSNYEIILISNNSVQKETKDLIRSLRLDNRIKAFEWNHLFNYSKINNYGVKKSSGEYLILLNNDTEVITPEWIDELLGVAIQPGVGAVGPMLLYPEEKNGIQHAGVILGMGTMAGHVFRHHQPGDWTDFGLPVWPRNYLALTAACLMVSKKLYKKVGGLDEIFTVAGNDVAFCLRLHEGGYRNIYWPFASLYHYESVSVGSYNNGIQLDYDHSLEYYKPYHLVGDKYFNPNLDLMNEQIGVKL